MQVRVALLAGGTGGGKLAAGLQDACGSDLSVIANTADDTEIHGLHVSPDPDLVSYWLAGVIDEDKGYGFRDDTSVVSEQLAALGAEGWFELTDRDLATCLYRTHFMAEGGTLTAAQAQIARSLGAVAAVLPMCEQRVRTRVLTPGGPRGLQEFLILDHGGAPIEGVELDGIGEATATDEVLEAIDGADAIVIGPSNPVISIGPILAVPGVRGAIKAASVPVIAINPLVGGHSMKGPTEEFLSAVGRPVSAAGVASLYEGLLDAMILDEGDPEPPSGVRLLTCPTLMDDAASRRALADRVLELAAGL
jgi:LPPG:FO 2-phospho-L-lactate transferase